MRNTFEYRLYPNKRQQRLFEQQLEECRWLYNELLAARRVAWEQRQESLRLYDQQATLPALKGAVPHWLASNRRYCKMSPFALIWPSRRSSDG
jgi:putative transposase